MKTFYRESEEAVKRQKPAWTIRWQGHVFYFRATHDELLAFLRGLASARRAS